MTFTAREIASATGGVVSQGPAERIVCGLSIDSRNVEAGQAFVAVVGSRADAHDFVSSAVRAGASLVIVHREVQLPSEVPVVLVEDTTAALADLGRHLRTRGHLSVVGVTGSAGKTTTKALTAAALDIDASPGNYNTVYGLALAIGNLPDDVPAVVLEMGISEPGEMSVLTDMVRPDVMILTNVAPAHTEFFPTLEELAVEKASCLRGLRDGGGAVWNGDDALLEAAVHAVLPEGARTLRFGESENVDLRLMEYRADGFGGGTARVRLPEDEELTLRLSLTGRHNAMNALAALGAGILLGRTPAAMASRMARASAQQGRGEILELGPVTVLDESYNANPRAMAAALETLTAGAGARRMVAVLGDMLELGESSAEYHRLLGELVAEAGVSLLIGVGPAMEETVRAAREKGIDAVSCRDAVVAGTELARRWSEGDVILVKGSRSVETEKAVDALREAIARSGEHA